jgi:predicted RNA-binding Zn-ribbon protein involved in translation (DUF1610 family)
VYCPICGTAAEDVTKRPFGGQTVQCPVCGEYDISRSVICDKRWEELAPDGRRHALNQAKQSSQPGKRPMITTSAL